MLLIFKIREFYLCCIYILFAGIVFGILLLIIIIVVIVVVVIVVLLKNSQKEKNAKVNDFNKPG